MKSIYSYALLGALFAVGAATAATTTTTPVGYVSLGDTTTGQPAVKASTDVALSIPLVRATEASGVAAAGATATSLTITGAAFTVNQFAVAGTPYLVTVKTGAQKGAIGLISANTATSLTVSAVNGSNFAAVGSGDTVQIAKAWTLKSLFTGNTIPTGTRVLAFTGTNTGINAAADLQYVYNGTSWINLVGSANSDNVVLYPGESFILRTATTAITSLVVTGEVPTAPHRIDLAKLATTADDNRVGYTSPVEEAISVSGLGFTTGDRLLAFDNTAAGINKSSAVTLVWNGTKWLGLAGVTAGSDQSAYTLKPGVGYIYQRVAAAPVGTVDWTDAQTYIPNL